MLIVHESVKFLFLVFMFLKYVFFVFILYAISCGTNFFIFQDIVWLVKNILMCSLLFHSSVLLG